MARDFDQRRLVSVCHYLIKGTQLSCYLHFGTFHVVINIHCTTNTHFVSGLSTTFSHILENISEIPANQAISFHNSMNFKAKLRNKSPCLCLHRPALPVYRANKSNRDPSSDGKSHSRPWRRTTEEIRDKGETLLSAIR